ncbi:hypothetical protein ACLB2K_006115 [Fragaria x ananassa]
MQQFGALPVMHLNQQATCHARMVYVGGLPPTANEQSVAEFFSHVMHAIGGNTSGPGDPVVNVNINHERNFALVEMRSVEEASNAMALDGIVFEGSLRVRRPNDYNPSMAATLGPSQPSPNLNLANVGLIPSSTSTGGLEVPDCILFASGLPYFITEAQIKELLESFGSLRCFQLVKDSEKSEGFAFCVYQNVSVTNKACEALNGIRMGDMTITVRRANQSPNQPEPELLQFSDHSVATKVVCLTRAYTDEELKDDLMYEYIMKDMKLEALRYGSFRRVIIPRPRADGEPSYGVGKVFMEFADVDGATKAHAEMNAGWTFGGKPVAQCLFLVQRFDDFDPDLIICGVS